MTDQMAFDLPHRAGSGRDAFFVAESNQTAWQLIGAPKNWPQKRLILTGPPASGKTHLAQIFTSEQGAVLLHAKSLTEEHIQTSRDKAVVVEDIQQIGRHVTPADGQKILFHIINQCLEKQQYFLMTGSDHPAEWPIDLPDLRSRLDASHKAKLGRAEDVLLRAVIVKLFDDRQIAISPDLPDYLIKHIERSLAGVQQIIARLDREGLQQQKPITPRFAKKILQ